MLTMLSGFASHERDVIRKRSVAGAIRVAEAGAWLGGIVPYGYRKVGEKRNAHLVISGDPIPGPAMSEADVIREVFRMAAVEQKSCRVIAVRLNDLRIPSAYVRDDRLCLHGKRKQITSGLWRPGRIRGLITNKTYMGTHEFGKRTAGGRPVVSRPVPAIVIEEVWRKAQANLKAHGLPCAGITANRPNGKREFSYRCNGAHSPSIFMARGRCQSKPVRGDQLEGQVWSDVETLLRNPEPVLRQLHAKLEAEAQGSGQFRKQVTRLEGLLTQKAAECSRVVGLFRRGRLTDADWDARMDEIGKQETALEAQIDELRCKIGGAGSIGEAVSSAQALLAELRKRLDAPVAWEQKRRLIEVLVAGIRVDTVEECGVKQTRTTVTYRFSQPSQPMPIVLPQSYNSGRGVRIPTELNTVGDHIRRRRLALKLLQKDVADQVGVDKCSVFNWETNTVSPDIRCMPAIIRFLGYNPLPEAKSWGERLVRHRTSLGMTQGEAAKRLGVDPGTLARWERGEREPAGVLLGRAERFLDDGAAGAL